MMTVDESDHRSLTESERLAATALTRGMCALPKDHAGGRKVRLLAVARLRRVCVIPRSALPSRDEGPVMDADSPEPQISATTDVKLLAGRYQILDKLGQGGMGIVFLARDSKLDRSVAVKVLPPGAVHDPEAVARFRREARALARLSHPSIIQAYDSGVDGEQHFLVMELVEGHTLARVLAEKGRVSSTRAADLGHQAALALHHAHQHGLIHRDVKPSNLLLAADGRVKVLDLGLARFLQDQIGDGGLTREGTGVGTPDYASPEQFRDARKSDGRSDIYSLGCTLYHLVAGRVPFPGSSLSEKVKAHETKEPPPLEELCPDLPVGLSLAVQRAMAKRPADRFQSMAEFAEALAPYVAGSSLPGGEILRSSTWDGSRLSTSVVRRRAPVRMIAFLAGAAVFVVLVLGLVGLVAGWFRPEAARFAGGPGTRSFDSGQSPSTGGPNTDGASNNPAAGHSGDPNVLTVSRGEKDGGKYRTINDALTYVTAGQTIMVLDDATYTEALVLNRPDRYNAVTLTALRRATLAIPADTRIGVRISNISNLVFRGFRVKGLASGGGLIVVDGQSSGVTLDDLDLDIPPGTLRTGVSIEGVRLAAGADPLTVRNCRFQGGDVALHLSGTPFPSAGIVIRENTFRATSRSVLVRGAVSRTQIVANRFLNAGECGIHLGPLSEEIDSLLIANNTFDDCLASLRLADTAPKGRNVRICNNLILAASQIDIFFLKWTGEAKDQGAAGDGTTVAKTWNLGHNWREVKVPTEGTDHRKAWVPPDPGKGDVRRDEIEGVNRVVLSREYLRPDPKSLLASAGAGKVDPSLPSYVGALPPEGTEPWDWDRTRRARVKKDEDGK
jgi:serine/threonine protein kinase